METKLKIQQNKKKDGYSPHDLLGLADFFYKKKTFSNEKSKQKNNELFVLYATQFLDLVKREIQV